MITVQRDTDGDGEPDITDTDDDGAVSYTHLGYGKPDGSVAEFYFDNDGIHFTKGESGIALTMTTASVSYTHLDVYKRQS